MQNMFAALDELLGRRVAGEPIAYILGQKEFWSLDLIVTPATLIPRPDTELLVEWGLEQLNGRTNAQVLDLGTGSGNIVLALATQNPGHRYLATDISEDCLAVARHNAQRHNMSKVEFRVGSWFAPLSSTDEFDVIVSNPPYIAKNDPWLKQGDVQKEPDRALVSSAQGLADISHIIGQAGQWLKDTGCIGLEHGYNQAEEVRRLFAQYGYTDIQTRCDLAGHERITTAKKGSLTGLN